MPSLIFLDTNIPIYAQGSPHPLQVPCSQILMLVAQHPESFITNAEVLQELLHYCRRHQLWPSNLTVIGDFARLMRGRIAGVEATDVQAAAGLAQRYSRLSARDLLHVATMSRLGVTTIVSTDQDYDSVGQLTRYDPLKLSRWRGRVIARGG